MRNGRSRVEDRLTMDVERIPSRSEGERLPPGPVHWVRFFSSSREEPRARRASDVIIGVTSAVVLVGLGFVVDPQAAFEQALIDLLDALPRALEVFWRAGWGLLVVWVVVVPLTALIQKRPELVRDIIAAGAIAVVLGTSIGMLASSQWPGIGQAVGSSGPPPVIPALRLAAVVAVISTSSPHLSRPFRRLGRWLVAIGAFSAVVLGITTPLGAIVAVLTGAVGASVVHLVFGSTAGRPGLGDVRAALSELGVPVTTLEPARRQTAGLFVLHATTADGAPIDVKVYGRDAWDTQLLARIWRALWYRELRSAVTLTRLQQAEHEAFVTLLAARHGVAVPEVVTAGRTARQDALLILRHVYRSRGDRQVDDATLAQVWDELATLHRAGIAHGDIRPEICILTRDGPVLADLSTGTLAPTTEQVTCDQAQLLVTTAVLAPHDQALAAALDHLGPETFAGVISYVQPAALGVELRRQVDRAELDLDDLRSSAATLAGVPPAELARLRRLTWGGVGLAALLTFATYALISAFGDLDLADLADELKAANWALLFVALLLAQTTRLAQAVSARGASPIVIPYGPLAALQFAISFVALAIPTAAARIAVNVRFFQRQGAAAAIAFAIGVLDSVAGFVVQVGILVTVLVLGVGELGLELDPDRSANVGALILLVIGIAVLAIAVVLVIPRLRRAVVYAVKRWGGEALGVVRGLRSPQRIANLFGGNLAAEILFASTLGLCCLAFGAPVSLGTLLLISVVTSLFAGLMPVPGGIGVTEGALIAGLTAAGVPSETAFAAVMCYRFATFYLPPIWGGMAFRWLERNAYL
jgi:glycosyltransferase 2 family protein